MITIETIHMRTTFRSLIW